MNKENKYSSFYDEYTDDFYEYLDRIKVNLQYNNKEYKRLEKDMNKLIDTSENIQNIICDDRINNPLSIEESKKLAKIISIYIDMQMIAEKEIYFRGGAGAYEYFKKIGIII